MSIKVNLFPDGSCWRRSRSFRLVSLACCFVLLSLSKINGQAPDPSSDPSAQPSIFERINPSAMSDPDANPSEATPAATAAARDTDISSPRLQQVRRPTLRPQLPAPLPLSEFQRVVRVSTGKTLPIFGANLFNTVPSTFAPVDNIPVTPDYVIGPGDELRLQVWGQVNQHGSFFVDRTGSISLPQVGTIHVAGLQFSQLSDFLKSQLGRVYRNFDLNVNLGQLRSIQVLVTGRAVKPGSFTIGSLSTLINALFASGGPLPQGSLRDIQVKRGSDTVTHFDLYDLLLRGDKSKDVRLESGDVIFIPDVGPQIAVLGSVTNPAIYEVQSDTNFNQAIALAGGLTNSAAGSQVRVERIADHTQRSVLTVNLTRGDTSSVHDGDIISVNSIVDRFQNAVTLRGNVANPGRYVWHEGMHISDLIPNREALITSDYYVRQAQLGQHNQGYLDQSSAGSRGRDNQNHRRQNDNYSDSQDVPGSRDQNNQQDQSQNDQNNQQDQSQNNDQEFPAQNSPDGSGVMSEGSLGVQEAAQTDRGTTPASRRGTSVGTALTSGSNTFPVKNDVILSAPDIDWEYAVIERQNQSTLTTSLLPFNLGKVVMDHDQSQNLELLNGDVVTIFSKADIRVPTSQQTKFVRLEGEFEAAGPYSVLPGETLRQLLVRAGGLTPDAYLYASEFTRESVRKVERQRINDYADTLEGEISARSANLASSAVTDRDAAAAQASAVEARSTLARLRQAQPTGRIVFQLQPDTTDIAALPDLPLEDGDRFIVPRKPATISVQGQVYNANAFIYEKGERVKDYLHLAGGPDRNADRNREFILRADGSVVSHQYASFGQRALFSNRSFADVTVLPGDTIIVPPTIERGSTLRNISNIANIVEGFGLGAAAIQVLK
jgi:polysaccharide export outer membrane protein